MPAICLHNPRKLWLKFISIVLPIALTVSIFSLTGCGPVHSRSAEYVQAKNDPELKLPKSVSTDKIKNFYPIPETDNKQSTKPAELTPPGLVSEEQTAQTWLAENKQQAKHDKNNTSSNSSSTDEAAT